MVGLILFTVAMGLSIAWLFIGGINYIAKHEEKFQEKNFMSWKNDDVEQIY